MQYIRHNAYMCLGWGLWGDVYQAGVEGADWKQANAHVSELNSDSR